MSNNEKVVHPEIEDAAWAATKKAFWRYDEYRKLGRMDIAGNRTFYTIFATYAEQQPAQDWLVFERSDGHVSSWTYAEFIEIIGVPAPSPELEIE